MPALVLLGYAESGGCTERKQDRTQNKVIGNPGDASASWRPFPLPIERGSDQAAPPARVDGLGPRMKCLPPRGKTAGHLSGSDRATRCPTGNSPPHGATPVGQGCLAVSTVGKIR